jgi:hypothetical protein
LTDDPAPDGKRKRKHKTKKEDTFKVARRNQSQDEPDTFAGESLVVNE